MTDWLDLLQELLNVEEGLTGWEVQFLEGLAVPIDDEQARSPTITKRQFAKLCEIWERVLG